MTVGWWAEQFAEFELAADAGLDFGGAAVEVEAAFVLAADASLVVAVEKVSATAEFTLDGSDAGLEVVYTPKAEFGLASEGELSFTATGHNGWTPGDEDGVITLPHKVPYVLS